VRVVTAPFGAVTVSMVSDGLCQDGCASAAEALAGASSARPSVLVPTASANTAQAILMV
jgi:hypothetical protein